MKCNNSAYNFIATFFEKQSTWFVFIQFRLYMNFLNIINMYWFFIFDKIRKTNLIIISYESFKVIISSFIMNKIAIKSFWYFQRVKICFRFFDLKTCSSYRCDKCHMIYLNREIIKRWKVKPSIGNLFENIGKLIIIKYINIIILNKP